MSVDSSRQDITKILPENVFTHVATFLTKSSCAIFAAAITAPSSSWAMYELQRQPSPAGKAILLPFEEWSTFDFVEVGKLVANKLTDDDIGAILSCIGAKHNLKKLKLTGCIDMFGFGLEPLRGSVALEQLDLSLVCQHESPDTVYHNNICYGAVLPVLESIINEDDTVLKHIQFPKKWRRWRSATLDRFLLRYKELLDSRDPACSKAILSWT